MCEAGTLWRMCSHVGSWHLCIYMCEAGTRNQYMFTCMKLALMYVHVWSWYSWPVCVCLKLVLITSTCLHMWSWHSYVYMCEAGTRELTLVHELTAMTLWCNKFMTSTPPQLVACFKSQLTAKSSTSAVRTAIVSCISATFNGLCSLFIHHVKQVKASHTRYRVLGPELIPV